MADDAGIDFHGWRGPSTRRLGRVILLLLLTAIGMLAPANVMASCAPIQMQGVTLEPGTVVMAGTVTQVTPGQVVLAIERWWGTDAQTNAAVDRPAVDPTVISSTDWNPQPGEAWLIVAQREDDSLSTNVCAQMPSTPDAIAELDTNLGLGSDPRAASSGSTTPEAPVVPIAVGAFVIAVVAAGLFAASRRRTEP